MVERDLLIDQSISVQRAAELMDVSESTINDLLEKGQLTGHYVGRVRRVYVRAIEDYREGRPIMSKGKAKPKPRTRRSADAIKQLRNLGVVV